MNRAADIGADRVISVIYSSRSTGELSGSELDALLGESRRNNEAAGITGMLLYREGRFLQVLEGSHQAVWGRMNRIETDPRHRDVRVLLEESADARRFPDWSMAFPRVSDDDTERIPGFRDTFDDLDGGHGGDGDESGGDDEGDGGEVHPRDSAASGAVRELARWFQVRLARDATRPST